MDVSQDLAEYKAKKWVPLPVVAHGSSTAVLDRVNPIDVDAGLLAAFDNTPVDADEYKSNLDAHLLALTLTSTHALISSLFSLPKQSSSSGPTVALPAPKTLLPREKPLPKAKDLTKWERFAKAKGISHKKKDKMEWDDDRQDWVARWGRNGKNKQSEEQWIHEVKAGEGADMDPGMTARKERKDRKAKNEKQRLGNLSASANRPSPLSTIARPASTSAAAGSSVSAKQKAQLRAVRKSELERDMLISKTSTASMGKFDKKIEGEPRSKGIKRKFEANEVGDEKDRLMSVLKGVERGEGKKSKKGGEGKEGDVNVRKAVRYEGRVKRAQAAGRDKGKKQKGGKVRR